MKVPISVAPFWSTLCKISCIVQISHGLNRLLFCMRNPPVKIHAHFNRTPYCHPGIMLSMCVVQPTKADTICTQAVEIILMTRAPTHIVNTHAGHKSNTDDVQSTSKLCGTLVSEGVLPTQMSPVRRRAMKTRGPIRRTAAVDMRSSRGSSGNGFPC